MGDTAAKIVWDTLSKVDVSERIQEKGGLSYLSWAWAIQTLSDNFPNWDLHWHEDMNHENTVMVECSITIAPEGVDGTVTRSAWLPVMDYRNNAIEHPDAHAVNTARQRCLTKCIALHGLGLYIYAGEDVPASTETSSANGEAKDDYTPGDGVVTAYKVFAEDAKDVSALTDFWNKNSDELTKLQRNAPEIHQQILSVFRERKTEILKETQQ